MTDEAVVSIYALLDEQRQIRYVGHSKDPYWRARKHWRERRAKQTTVRNPDFCAWLQSMDAQPSHYVLQVVPYVDRFRAEEYWTDLLRQVPGVDLLNISSGARLSSGTKSKMGASRTGRPSPMKGKKQSDETRALISSALRGRKRGPLSDHVKDALRKANEGATWNRGRKHTDEARANMSLAHLGKRPSDETRAKMSAASKGRKLSDEARANISAGAKAHAAVMKWCPDCEKDWSVRVWARHVRKYHEGGAW